MFAIGISLLLSGCVGVNSNKEDVNKKIVDEKNVEKIYKGLSIGIESYVEEDKLMVKIKISNQKDELTPLNYKGKVLGTIQVLSNGKVLSEEYIESSKKEMSPQEEFLIEKTFEQPKGLKEYVVSAKLNVEDNDVYYYGKDGLKVSEVVKLKEGRKTDFLPNGEKKYIYQTVKKDKKEIVEQEEKFVYFKDGYVQSIDSLRGTKIYYLDSKGFYYVYSDKDVIEDNLIKKVEHNKKTILEFPIEIGKVWETDGIEYEITDVNARVNTKIGKFDNVIEVTSNFGTGMKYFYHKDIGLLEVKVNNEGIWETKTKIIGKK